MTAAVSRPASPDSRPVLWIVLPAAVSAVLAVGVVFGSANETWFVDWNRVASGILPPFMWAGITNLGSTLGAFALLTPTLAWRPRWLAAALLAAPAATLYTHGLKQLFDQPRPAGVLPLEHINVIGLPLRTDGFPSGHTVTAFVLAGVLALSADRDERRWLGWVVLAMAATVAFSRVAVGAHWPLDIFAGAAGGWACGAIGVRWSEAWRFWEHHYGIRAMALLMMLAAARLAVEDLGYPEGLWMQYLLVAWGMAGAGYALVRPQPCTVRA